MAENDVAFLEEFRRLVDEYLILGYAPSDGAPSTRAHEDRRKAQERLGERYAELRRRIAEMRPRAKQLTALAEAQAIAIQYPPPAIGGPVIHVHLLDAVTANPTWRNIDKANILDVIDHTIGALRSGALRPKVSDAGDPELRRVVSRGFVFIAMPMIEDDPGLQDVYEAIKEVARDLRLVAERVDDPVSNRRITDRVLESLAEAEFVIVDLTHARPNVYFEAGVAHGRGQLPIYIAREGTEIHFDLKDYPVIFFENITGLKEGLKRRLAGLQQK